MRNSIALGAVTTFMVLAAMAMCAGAMPVEMTGDYFTLSFDIPGSTVLENNGNITTNLVDGAYESETIKHCYLKTETGGFIHVLYWESSFFEGFTDESLVKTSLEDETSEYKTKEIEIDGYPGLDAYGMIIGGEEGNMTVVKLGSRSFLSIASSNVNTEDLFASFSINPVSYTAIPLPEQMSVEMGGEQFVLSFEVPNSTIIQSGDNSITLLTDGSYQSMRQMYCRSRSEEGDVNVFYFETTADDADDIVGKYISSIEEAITDHLAAGYNKHPIQIGGYAGFEINGEKTGKNVEKRNIDIAVIEPNENSIVVIAGNDTSAYNATCDQFAITAS